MLVITEHFAERWRQEFGEDPPPSGRLVAWLNTRSVWLQSCRMLYDKDGVPFKMLAYYLLKHQGRTVVVKIDTITNKTVTIVSFKSRERKIANRKPEPHSLRGRRSDAHAN